MTTLTNDQITAGAAVLCDHGQPIGRNAAIEVFDAMQGTQPVASAADVLTIPTAIMEMPCDVTLSHFPSRHEMAAYKQGHRAARHAAADLVLARADELKALAAPSPQVADIAELPPRKTIREVFEHVGGYWTGDGACPTFGSAEALRIYTVKMQRDAVQEAIAASRRAGGEEVIYQKLLSAGVWSDEDKAEYDAREGGTWRVLAAPVSAGQAAPYHACLSVACSFDHDSVERHAAMSCVRAVQAALAAQPAEASAGQAGQVDWQTRALRAEELLKQFAKDGDDLCKKLDATERAAAPAKFQMNDEVRKTKGSQWRGKVVGTYSTELTPEGYAVESSTERGSVQIYPAAALELVPADERAAQAGQVATPELIASGLREIPDAWLPPAALSCLPSPNNSPVGGKGEQ